MSSSGLVRLFAQAGDVIDLISFYQTGLALLFARSVGPDAALERKRQSLKLSYDSCSYYRPCTAGGKRELFFHSPSGD